MKNGRPSDAVRRSCPPGQFHRQCFEEAGWEDPLGSGYYILRRPRHASELQQAVGRGLLPPEEGLEEIEHE